jgi:ribosomal 50S subunit-recycling heat shock protein
MLIFKKRNEAKEMCLNNLIKVNGQYIKPSKKIQEGDIIEIETTQGIRKEI